MKKNPSHIFNLDSVPAISNRRNKTLRTLDKPWQPRIKFTFRSKTEFCAERACQNYCRGTIRNPHSLLQCSKCTQTCGRHIGSAILLLLRCPTPSNYFISTRNIPFSFISKWKNIKTLLNGVAI